MSIMQNCRHRPGQVRALLLSSRPRPPAPRYAKYHQHSEYPHHSASGVTRCAAGCLRAGMFRTPPTTSRRPGKRSRVPRVVLIVEGCGSDFAFWTLSTILVDFRGGRGKWWTCTGCISGIASAKSLSSGGGLVLSPKGLRSEAAAACRASRIHTVWFRWFL